MGKIVTILIAILLVAGMVIGGFFAYAVYYANKKPVGQIFVASAPNKENVDIGDIASLQAQAEQEDKTAEYKLALAYSIGKGVKQDYSEAASWAQKSAEQGFAKAQTLLGVMYMKGEGVEANDETAYMWLLIAASQNDQEAQITLKMYKEILPQEEMDAAGKRAAEWKEAHG